MVRKRNITEAQNNLSSEEEQPAQPRTKKTKPATTKAVDDEGNPYWELSTTRTPRRATISEFKGSSLISLREYYEKDGKFLPGKKGISLTTEQYLAFLKAIPYINAELRSKGVMVSSLDDAEAEAGVPTSVKAKEKAQKSNIEATSDEEEDDE